MLGNFLGERGRNLCYALLGSKKGFVVVIGMEMLLWENIMECGSVGIFSGIPKVTQPCRAMARR